MPISLPIPIHPSHNFFTSLISSSSSQSRPSSPPAATHTWSTGRPRSAEPVIPHRQHKIPLTPPSPLPPLSPLANTNKPKLREGEQAKSQTTKKIKNNYAVPTPLPSPPPLNPSLPTPKRITNPTPTRKKSWRRRGERHPKPPSQRQNKSDAITHVNVLGQQVVRRLVVLQRVGVDAGAREGASEEEAEEPGCRYRSLAILFFHEQS